MTTQEIIDYLRKTAGNCAIVADNGTKQGYTHKDHWDLLRLHILDLANYIEYNSN